MGWTDIAWLVFVGWAVAAGVWVALSRPRRGASCGTPGRYLRARPQASAGDLREALRPRFLGGSPPSARPRRRSPRGSSRVVPAGPGRHSPAHRGRGPARVPVGGRRGKPGRTTTPPPDRGGT